VQHPAADTGAYYRIVDEGVPGPGTSAGRYTATEHTCGPWDARLQHAGPPAALLTRAVQRLTGLPDDGVLARVCLELLAPIPVTTLRVDAHVPRPGRRVAWARAVLVAAAEPARPLALLHAWFVRRAPEPLAIPDAAPDTPPGSPDDRQEQPIPDGWGRGYLDSVRWRWVDGGFDQPGPGTVWTQLRGRVVEGEEPDGAQRLMAVVDSASGISAMANPADLTFVNTDLTVHLLRPVQGADVWVRAATVLDAHGVGLARSDVGDRLGQLGASAQTLFVEPRDAARA